MTKYQTMCQELTEAIERSYTEGVTMDEAEKLAGRFLHAQMATANELRDADLDARMRKSGNKSLRAAVYLEAATKDPKKPSDVLLEALVNSNELVQGEQTRFDEAEVNRDALQNYLSVFREAHVHFRTIAKGKFDA